jgi:hypothetical protein
VQVFQPAHVDGRSLVILRRRRRRVGWAFSVAASGRLEHDGEVLSLVGNGPPRVITDRELAAVMPVKPDTRIAECRGFDLFLIVDESAEPGAADVT